MRTIQIELPRADLRWGAALGLLQAGFSMRARAGISARAFMRETLGFPDAYIEGAVSTVFIDDSPVDDIDAARLAEGSRIALSAAMPGLVGAVMRRHSPYAALRESISYRERTGGADEGRLPEIRVGVKLFNSVMVDRGPEVLARGIHLGGEKAIEALRWLGIEDAAATMAPAGTIAAKNDAEFLLRICEAPS